MRVLSVLLALTACAAHDPVPVPAVSTTAQALVLFDPGAVPAYLNVDQGYQVEIGVEVWSDNDGLVDGVRFYKGNLDTGMHIGHLWKTDGTLLATAVFTAETASGWQEARFLPAIPMSKGTHFVVSYHTSTGFSWTPGLYASQADAAPLHVPASGGKYVFASIRDTPSFPSSTYQNSSYWVDVDFRSAPSGSSTSLYAPSATPPTRMANGSPIELGVTVTFFRQGAIHGIRFYRLPDSTGASEVHVWDSSGNLLASAPSSNDTASGWQDVPVQVNVQDGATYVLSYSTSGDYSTDPHGFDTAIDVPPLHAPIGAGVSGEAGTFPRQLNGNASYFVDVDYEADGCAPSCSACGGDDGCGHVCCAPVASSIWQPGDVTSTTSTGTSTTIELGTRFTVATSGVARAIRYYKSAEAAASTTGNLWDAGGNLLATATFTPPADPSAEGWQEGSLDQFVGLSPGPTYTVSYEAPSGHAYTGGAFASGTGTLPVVAVAHGGVYGFPGSMPANVSTQPPDESYWADVVFVPDAPGVSLFPPWISPAEPQYGSGTHFELGMQFQSSEPGWISGIRFYKGTGNNGSHVAHLWQNGQLMSTANFTNETTSGWQEAVLPTPVLVQPGVTYTASYNTSTGFAWTMHFFDTPFSMPPLSAPVGAGVYAPNQGFPTNVYLNSSYFVDVDFRPQTSCLADRTCTASDPFTYRLCMDQVATNVADVVEIQGKIECTAANRCFADAIVSPGRPITIRGVTPGAGFHRTGDYTYPIIQASFADDLTISDLDFDEEQSTTCPLPQGSNCAGTIQLSDDDDVRILRISTEWDKAFGIQLDSVNGVLVRGSTFTGSFYGAIWMQHDSDATASSDVHVENNTFKDIHGGAITFSAHGKAVPGPDISYLPSTITGNAFQHNHWDVVDTGCGGPTSPCPGGQLVIEEHTQHLLIENNQIFDGHSDVNSTLGIAGIEMALGNVTLVTVEHNDIHDNTGSGVMSDAPFPLGADIDIEGNRFYCNLDSIGANLSQASTSGNCSTTNCGQPSSDCPFAFPSGTISASPNPCSAGLGGSCYTTVSYADSNAGAITVRGPAGRVAGDTSGVLDVSGVTLAPTDVDLYSDETLLGTVQVRAQSSNQCTQ